MRIAVTDVGRTFGRQTRAYAEYRIFSSLARFSRVVHDVDVSLTSTRLTHGSTALCVVVVTVGDGSRLHVRARGRHAYDAINRAARRIGDALRRHTDIQLSS
jgi:ribosome-associated translation inhibitor RaiA